MPKLFKGMVTLTLGNGEPIYVNPDTIVAVTKSTGNMDNNVDYSIRHGKAAGQTLLLTTAHGAFNHLIVKESIDKVMELITWKQAE